MKKICIFTLYTEVGASSYYRAYIFKDELEKDYQVKWCNFWGERYSSVYMHNKKKYFFVIMLLYFFAIIKRVYQLMYIAPKYDTIFIQKACIPKCSKLFLNRIIKNNRRIIYDVDDAVYLDNKDYSNDIAKKADIVICGNENLKKHYYKYNNNIVIIPTVENTNLYKKWWKDTFSEKVIGWIGSKTTVVNFEIIVDAINKIVARHPEVTVHIISNSALDYDNRINNCKLIPWHKEKYVEELSKITIGIMPLIDNPYNHGKCGFKLIQYLNMKKPVVASNIGVNNGIVGNCGITVSSIDDWENALETLLFDEKFYEKCVQNINKSFFPQYAFESVYNDIKKVL